MTRNYTKTIRTKNAIKKDQTDILNSLNKYKICHIVWLLLAIAYKGSQFFVNSQPLVCDHSEIISSLKGDDLGEKKISIHTSADVESAMLLELQFACYYVANCSQHLDVWLEAEQEPKLNFTTPFGDQLNCSVEVIGGEPSDKELYCLDTVCPPDAFGLPETASNIPEFVQISSNQPIASQGSMIFFFWDVLWIVFGMLVWYRLQSLKDMNLINVAIVIDEKDIGTISLQCLLATVTMVFYSIDAACSWLWIYMHNRERLHVEHASYFTVYARNYSLATWHTGYVLLIMCPAIFLSVQMKKKLCKYEKLQFAIES